ncbi:5-formyltetrahydrofolate cyclo-ligase [Weissella cibaria]|uniref:5-formyltetrahydrofolate cyclo-ligase n=1 Tax=Weissella cibaria TaxID=137591 RepID=UPI00143F4361|nr:5-formyltetrahydrofolate cyclo-ligase [Weissella cibaria]MBU7544276.1 5-formyltetrahydrofolate cyclo-ligase [Weissella cibaria]MCT0020458.1 5-formyltetrahydrofolate cyclo-ligase [Weissella cibaria]MCT0957112.1 5-formyltetrahydrofolate cyclo-ligase [Weissella cibaria]MCV3317439.1 5-formyltetrahydrofolate cyclo-ligase [Weissella cibaria]NKN30254.1 5-formyltetrahydrofolate cyclo-ligase [Weissella cibaria]
MEKAAVRQQALANLAALSDAQRGWLMQAVVAQVTALPAWQSAKTVALTLSQDDEIPTQLLIQTAMLQGKRVVLPRVQPGRQMTFIVVTPATTYERHRFGMLEPVGDEIVAPTEIDFVVVPGLAFSEAGDRIGFGGGYYDRWLPQTTARTVALALAENVYPQPSWPLEPTDQQVDQVLIFKNEE